MPVGFNKGTAERFEIVEFQGVRYSEDGTAAAEGMLKYSYPLVNI